MQRRTLGELYRSEFRGYDAARLRADVFAGLTVGAVALPLALAFGVASGATAAAGMVTAVAAGLVIGALSGAPYQISGPTGAMSAVLLVLAQRHGLPGVWIAGMLSGVFLLAIGALGLGRFIAFIPGPVVSGFTSGIALIIAIGQVDNFLGVHTPGADSAAEKLLHYFAGGFVPSARAVELGFLVVVCMLLWPRRWNARLPASLVGIALATAVAALAHWHVETIGAIPRTLVLEDRLVPAAIPWGELREFFFPACTITALGAVESLLCGAVASNMTGIRLAANQELLAQGCGNLLIPFLGGVPATAAIARTSVGIKSGGRTRLTSVVHALLLLASMFVLAPVMSRIPLAALAGVLLVTAWRMNEWEAIRFIFGRRFKTGMTTFLVTMLATIVLDLTQAILVGAAISCAVFMSQIARVDVRVEAVDRAKAAERGIVVADDAHGIYVVYVTGPLFFAATGTFLEAVASLRDARAVILSMRGSPLVDTSGIHVLLDLHEKLQHAGTEMYFAGVHPPVRRMFERSGLLEAVGEGNVTWSADQAIAAASARLARPA